MAVCAGAFALARAGADAAPMPSQPHTFVESESCSTRVASVSLLVSDRSQVVPMSVEVVCPKGIAYSVSLPPESSCGQARPFDLGGSMAYVSVELEGGRPWCDGTNGSAVISNIGTGTMQIFRAQLRFSPSQTDTPLAGHFIKSFEIRVMQQ